MPGQWTALAALWMALDVFGTVTPGSPLIIGEIVPPGGGGAELDLGGDLGVGAGLGGGGMGAFALAVSALEGDDDAALPAAGDIANFHSVMWCCWAGGGIAGLPAAAYAGGRWFAVSLRADWPSVT